MQIRKVHAQRINPLNLNEISAFIRTDRRTWLLLTILIKHTGVVKRIYTHQKLARKNAIVEYLDYHIPVTLLKGPKGNRDMQAEKRG